MNYQYARFSFVFKHVLTVKCAIVLIFTYLKMWHLYIFIKTIVSVLIFISFVFVVVVPYTFSTNLHRMYEYSVNSYTVSVYSHIFM
jgi:hypothetical protein